MIIGVFLKNYKVYDGMKFIPITFDEYFTAYFGQNGVGKSSILEAFDTFFNGRQWNPYKSGKGGTGYINIPYIVPVFLIPKSEIQTSLKKYLQNINLLSDYFWNVDKLLNSPEGTTFIEYRNYLSTKINQDNYYLLALGIKYDEPKELFFGTFQHQNNFFEKLGIKKLGTENQSERYREEDDQIKNFFQNGSDLLDEIKNLYHYIYIPSDVDVSSYTQLETINMQKLMHKDIKKEIQKAITQDKLDEINKNLKDFVDKISAKLGEYTYEKPVAGKNNITMPDLVNRIIKAYFSIRVLTKTKPVKVPVNNLSSGEKRKALIDVAHAFLDGDEDHDRKIILAIDEPEISLHISACYEQFEKLRFISSKKHQVLITTHWYGFLPVLGVGYAHNIVDEYGEKYITTYALSKYQEEINVSKIKHEPPYDVFLKGKYDLVQSIVASLRSENPYKYILVEGSSDKIYLEKYFQEFIESDRLRIMPLGGCGEVKNVMKHLFMATNETGDVYKGKVLALVDTDEKILTIQNFNDTGALKFRRIRYDSKTKNIVLEKIDSTAGCPITAIEDVLEPNIFIDTFCNFKKAKDKKFTFFENTNSGALCSYRAFNLTEDEREQLHIFFNEPGIKTEFAREYISNELNLKKLSISKDICNLLNLASRKK